MNKNSKRIGLSLAVLMATSFSLPLSQVHAQSINNNQVATVTKNTKLITDTSKSIKLIEQKFLIYNTDGTTSISNDAKNYIDSTVLAQLKDGQQGINNKIKNGELSVNQKTKEIKTSNSVKNNLSLNSTSVRDNLSLKAASTSVGNFYLDGTVIWHWYGFDLVLDATQSGILSAKLTQYAVVLGAGALLTASIPGLALVFGLPGAGYGYLATNAAEGSYKNGCIAYFTGPPSKAVLRRVQVK